MKFDIDKIRELADLIIEKGLAEIKVEDGDQSVTIKHPVGQTQQVIQSSGVIVPPAPQGPAGLLSGSTDETPQAPAPATAEDAGAETADDESKYTPITAPMVGTYYEAGSPDADAFVKVGDSIRGGQTLCIIEAMKMMNELEAEISGKIVKIICKSGDPVEFGQTLFLVDPNG